MTVFVVIPVFNRLHHTQRVLESLRAQTCINELRIVVINDGSTDGTREFLAAQRDVTTLEGDGTLWWAGAMERGLQYVLPYASEGDYVLFLNNDTWFAPNYVETLVRVSRENGGAAVGSVIFEVGGNNALVSIGPRVDINRLAVWDVLTELPTPELSTPKPVYRVDALSGRGTLYPAHVFKSHGSLRPRLLPHYWADYEIAMRFARDAGLPLIVSSQAVVFSPPVYGNEIKHLSWWERCFSKRSSSNLIHRLVFYCLVGSPFQRLSAPLRMLCFGISRYFQQKFKFVPLRT